VSGPYGLRGIPAWRINQTGVVETGNPLQAFTKLLFGADMRYQFNIFGRFAPDTAVETPGMRAAKMLAWRTE
jgi:hypothetical protein